MHTCPIHPNWVDSTKVIDEPSHQKSVRDVQSARICTVWPELGSNVATKQTRIDTIRHGVEPSNVKSISGTLKNITRIKQTEAERG